MAACGSDRASLKGDAEEGSVELTMGDETYTRQLSRTGSSLSFSGDPYLDDADVADLFAFLLESNEARLAVARQDDLRDIIMRPVDTDQLQAEIEQLEAEKRQLSQELDELEGLDERLPELEEERTRLEQRLEDKREELEETQAELEAADQDVEETREEKSELEAKFDELRDTRSRLEDVRYDIDTQQERLKSLRADRDDAESDLEDLSETPAGDVADIESEIRTLRERKQRLEADISDLQNIIQFNQDLLEEANSEVFEALNADDGSTDGAVTDQLLADETVTCWTCGSEVDADQIEGTVDRLRELSQRKVGDVRDVESELDDLTSEKRTLERERQRREQLERTVDRLESDIEETEARIEELEAKRDELHEEIESLETAVDELESTDYSEVLDLHKQVNQLEFEIDRIESDIDDIDDETESIEGRLDEREQIEAQREEIQHELTDLRTRIETIEEGAIDEFNDHMETVLDILEYSNLERVWIERTERDVREGRRKVTKASFDLHVIRASESGAAYEDTIDHLSESEREVTGLIFALAGYLVHEVYETCPFMLLDSLEAIDSDRIATLVEYFADYADYLVVALLEEDAAALDGDYHRVTEI